MAGLRFTELQSRPREFLDFTSLTLDEFQQLVPPFEAAFQARMATWRLDGQPRTARPVYRVPDLPTADTRGSALVYSRLCQDLFAPGGPGAPVQHGAEESQSVDSRPPARAAGRTAYPRRCSRPLPDGPSAAARCCGGGCRGRRRITGGGGSTPGCGIRCRAAVPPFAPDGTER